VTAMLGPKRPEFDYQLDNECPACGEHANIAEATDGEACTCGSCGAALVAVAYEDNIMRLHVEDDLNDDELTDDQSPLCDASIHYREDDGSDVIPW